MLQVEINAPDGTQRLAQVPDECIIGKGAANEIRLDSWRLGKEHARLFKTVGGVFVEDLGAFAGVFVNAERIESQYGPISKNDLITIGPFNLRVSEIGTSTGVLQAASPTSRSTSAAYRNQLATEEIRASREFAERRQDEVRRAQAAAMADPSSMQGAAIDATNEWVCAHCGARSDAQGAGVRVAQAHPLKAARYDGFASARRVQYDG